MITTQRQDLDQLSRSLRDHGASRTDLARHKGQAAFLLSEYNHLGYNYRMTDLQGALGCAQVERGEWILSERARRALAYDQALKSMEWLGKPEVDEGYVHGYQAYVCLFRPEIPTLRNVDRLHRWRNDLMIELEAKGIATRQGTHAPVTVGYYAKKYGLGAVDFPNAYLAERLTLTLPLFVQMTDHEQEFVISELQHAFKQL